jgi:hypothetical protein
MRATRRRLRKSYDEMIAGYYGKGPGGTRSIDDVLAGYYGNVHGDRPATPATRIKTLSRDDGEVIPQNAPPAPAAPAAPSPGTIDEYVVWNAAAPAAQAPLAAPAAPAAAPPAAAPAAPAPGDAPAVPAVAAQSSAADVAPSEEYGLDLRQPLASSSAHSTTSATTMADDELAADMEAILSGKAAYDPSSGTVREHKQAQGHEASAAPPSQSTPPPSQPAPQSSGELAIFDAIAQSMTYANAYDLGTVELENRFADFDRADDSKQAAATEGSGRATAPEAPVKVGGEDFIQDIDAIRERAGESGDAAMRRAAESMPVSFGASLPIPQDVIGRDLGCAPSALKLALSEPEASYARPMYDTGEHVLAGGDLYVDQLRVGPNPGVGFSYGELMSMGDLYETVEDMMRADLGELRGLKALIDRSTAYYKGKKATKALDVSNEQWNKATGKRYLELAEDNSEHFSPNTLFTDAIATAATATNRNNRSTWEAYHRRAIEEAQKLALLPENQNRSYIPEWPLIINAFGDHFLTDAFASGHLINKDVMAAYFRNNFYSGSNLNEAAKDFFARVAKAAWHGDVKTKFSALEQVETHVWKHWNIDTENAFRKLLVGIAEQAPDKVANIAVKALHDYLNENGVEVTNAAGDPQWLLTGDGHLNEKSLPIMSKAVQQSVANINDPSIVASNLDFGPYFEKVWRFVPQSIPSERTRIANLVKEYTNPRSAVASAAAAKVIEQQVDTMIDVLIEKKILQHDE